MSEPRCPALCASDLSGQHAVIFVDHFRVSPEGNEHFLVLGCVAAIRCHFVFSIVLILPDFKSGIPDSGITRFRGRIPPQHKSKSVGCFLCLTTARIIQLHADRQKSVYYKADLRCKSASLTQTKSLGLRLAKAVHDHSLPHDGPDSVGNILVDY